MIEIFLSCTLSIYFVITFIIICFFFCLILDIHKCRLKLSLLVFGFGTIFFVFFSPHILFELGVVCT